MFEKYQKRTYPEYFQPEDSETDKEVLKSTLKCKKASYINPIKHSDVIFQPECIFTQENKNISFYESDSNSSYKDRKNKSLNRNNNKLNYDSDFISNRKHSLQPKIYVLEQFSYNYTNKENNKNNNKNTPLNERICLDMYLPQKSTEVPKRTIKTYQNQFDVEKSDNFNVLSYRPEDYDSSYIKTDSKSKIIQIFKKDDVNELFYPSKRQQFSQSPPASNNTPEKKEQLLSYQTPTLKFQSFFGSYTTKEKPKNNNQCKSTSKRKINQLEDFNIDKLKEIGDNISGKMKNILSFGKKINNIKNKNKKNVNYYAEKAKIINQTKIKKPLNGNQNKKGVNMIENKKQNDEIKDNNNSDRKIMTKKIFYHGQIKRKRNIKNAKTLSNLKDETNKNNKVDNKSKKNINNNNPKKKLINNNSTNIINSVVDNNNSSINNKMFFINNNNNPDNKNNNNTSLKFKKINTNQNSKSKEFLFNKNKEKNLFQQTSPKKNGQKKKFDINLNDKANFAINNYENDTIWLEGNNYTNNHTMMNKENKPQTNLSKKVILTEEDNNYNDKIALPQYHPNNKKTITNPVNKEENGNKRFNKNNVSNNQSNKKVYDKSFKMKNYYGYDERHNLEGTINNHSYYVSLYSKRKINQNNSSTENIN